MDFYNAISPYRQNDIADIRGAEPYAYVQFVYGRDHEWFGKAQNPWLTGTAGWMYTAATKYILGVRPTLEGLVIDPSIPHGWDGFSVIRKWRGATYQILVENPEHVSHGVAKLEVDGTDLDPRQPVPIAEPGSTVKVKITLG